MKSILSICAFLMLFNINGFSQENINAYKYVIVPNSFNFLNEPDQYQINSLTKFLFEKYGFTPLMADEKFPQDLNTNRCLALYADVEKHKAFLNTKLQVHLKDCNNNVVFSSKTGESREKEYTKVYNLALRDAFASFETLNYSYEPSSKAISKSADESAIAVDGSFKAQEEIDRLKMEVEALKEKQVKEEKVVVKATKIENTAKNYTEVIKEAKATVDEDTRSNENFQRLSANSVENGYTITDASSKVLYHLVFSGKEDVYIVKGQDAIVYKMNNTWIVSTANASGVSMKTLNVKFN